MTTPATPPDFLTWMKQIDDILWSEIGATHDDLPDHLFKDWYLDDLTPEDAYYRIMEEDYPGIEIPNIYYQEFDEFSDADPGL